MRRSKAAARWPLFLISCVLVVQVNEACAATTRPSQIRKWPDVPEGFQVAQGEHIEIVTDMPLTDSIRELTVIFDKAIPVWTKTFSVYRGKGGRDAKRCRAYLMLERSRFIENDLLPSDLPQFPYGFQYGDEVWLMEQPSAYYRRHLLLHEGTHWFMNRTYGENGPPWLMEGMAEWFGTHRWDPIRQELEMGIIPDSKESFPYWGRMAIIREQMVDGLAPSLESVLRYGTTAHQQVDAYAWSWAVVWFLRSNPATRETFESIFRRPMKPDLTLTRRLFSKHRDRWPRLRVEWQAFVSDLDYGFESNRGMLVVSEQPQILAAKKQFQIQSSQGWQASNVVVRTGMKLRVVARGEYVIRETSKPWLATPDGVTLEYSQGHPLGMLLMTVVAPLGNEPAFTAPIELVLVGSELEYDVKHSGELHFRVNEPSGQLDDNDGTLTIEVSTQ